MEQVQLTSDIIIEFPDGSIVLGKRMNEPYKGMWGLPGGKMDEGETIEATAIREAKEETNLDIEITGIVGVYSQLGRDPRGRYISVVYTARVIGGELKAGSDATEIMQTTDYMDRQLAFDHNEILKDYLKMRDSSRRRGGSL